MKEIVKEALKSSLLLALIGAAVAVAVPFVLASMLGAATAGTLGVITGVGVLHTALLFGGFGLLDPIMRPLFSFIFGKDPPEQAGQTAPGKGPSDSRQFNINILQAPQQGQEQAIVESNYRQRIEAERVTAALNALSK
jgi:hypothetical protein